MPSFDFANCVGVSDFQEDCIQAEMDKRRLRSDQAVTAGHWLPPWFNGVQTETSC